MLGTIFMLINSKNLNKSVIQMLWVHFLPLNLTKRIKIRMVAATFQYPQVNLWP